MGLGHNDPWVESHMWPQQMWGQRSSRGQWPLVQVWAKRFTVSTYFDVFSWTWTQWSLGRVTHVTSTDVGSKVIRGQWPLVQVFFCKIGHCIHILWCIFMGLGHNDPWVKSHMWPQQMWGQRASRGQWPLVQVFAKTVTVSTYFHVCSGETRGSRTTCWKSACQKKLMLSESPKSSAQQCTSHLGWGPGACLTLPTAHYTGGVHGQHPDRGPGGNAPGSSWILPILNASGELSWGIQNRLNPRASGELSWTFINTLSICMFKIKKDTDNRLIIRADYAVMIMSDFKHTFKSKLGMLCVLLHKFADRYGYSLFAFSSVQGVSVP